MIIQNKAILEAFHIESEGSVYTKNLVLTFRNKKNGISYRVETEKVSENLLRILKKSYFPSSALILQKYLELDEKGSWFKVLYWCFNYRNLVVLENNGLLYRDKPNIYIDCNVVDQPFLAYGSDFNKSAADCLVDVILPLLKNQRDSLQKFFSFFEPTLVLKNKGLFQFCPITKKICIPTYSLFKNNRIVRIKEEFCQADKLLGKIEVGNDGAFILDESIFDYSDCMYGDTAKEVAYRTNKFFALQDTSDRNDRVVSGRIFPYNVGSFEFDSSFSEFYRD